MTGARLLGCVPNQVKFEGQRGWPLPNVTDDVCLEATAARPPAAAAAPRVCTEAAPCSWSDVGCVPWAVGTRGMHFDCRARNLTGPLHLAAFDWSLSPEQQRAFGNSSSAVVEVDFADNDFTSVALDAFNCSASPLLRDLEAVDVSGNPNLSFVAAPVAGLARAVCPAFFNWTLGVQQCPEGSLRGPASLSDGTMLVCACERGFELAASGEGCLACAAGSYELLGACVACAPGFTSLAEASSCFEIVLLPAEAALDTPALVLTVVFGVAAVAWLLYYGLKGRKDHPEAQHLAPLLSLLGLYDLITDIFFALSLGNGSLTPAPDADPAALATVQTLVWVFIALPFCANLAALLRLVTRELRTNAAFVEWFGDNGATALPVLVLSATNVDALKLLSSRLFGAEALAAPWTPAALQFIEVVDIIARIITTIIIIIITIITHIIITSPSSHHHHHHHRRHQVGGLISNVLEDIPQLVLQLFFALSLSAGRFSTLSALAVCASGLALLSGILARGTAAAAAPPSPLHCLLSCLPRPTPHASVSRAARLLREARDPARTSGGRPRRALAKGSVNAG
jgi:hypothetical protein